MEQHKCLMEDRIRALETGQAETRIYIREIREDIMEIKSDIKKASQQPKSEESKTWQPIVIKLIDVMGTAFAILAAIIGAVKIMGR